MIDVVALGELLIDFTDSGLSENGRRLFEQNPGGAPANVLCSLSTLGKRTAFLGKVGEDMHGRLLRQVLEEKRVDTRGLVMDPEVFTTLAFVALSPAGERSFSFARKPGADCCLRPEELDRELLGSCRVFHFGSLSLTDEPSRSATLEAVAAAKAAGAVISYDPNYRAPLWPSREAAREQIRSVVPLVDIMKLSDEELELLTGENSPADASARLLERGVRCVVVSLGSRGAYVACRGYSQTIPTYDGPVVDTTGAGDAFWGGFLYQLLESGLCLEEPGLLRKCAQFGNAVATLCVGKRGAIPALPTLESVLDLMACQQPLHLPV